MKIIRLIVLACISAALIACGAGKKLKKANEIYEAGGYDKAANLFRKVAPKIKDRGQKTEVYFKAAEAYHKSGNPALAGRYYDMAVRGNYPDPKIFLYNAEVALMVEDLDKAKKQIDNFRHLEPDNARIKNLQASYDLIAADAKKSTGYKIENLRNFNSRFHDYSPAYGSSDYETIYFTSSRREGKKKTKTYEATGQKNTDIFHTELSKNGWNTPSPLDNAMNTEDEEGSCVFNHNYTSMYFTQCVKEKRANHGCRIMVTKYQNGNWSEPEDLKLVPDSMVAAHPALSADGLTMYFSSNLKGGAGGLDLWRVTRGSENDNLWSEPLHMGSAINTPGDEMFPSVRKDTLYFASNGHPGYGGLDIFKAVQDSTGWIVVNMGKPINSPADDFGIIFENDNERGYFTSRRKGGRGGDDIYAISLDIPVIEYYVAGIVRDAKTNAKLARAELKLSGDDGSSLKRVTEKDGAYKFRLASNAKYLITVTREEYFAQKSNEISTFELKESKTFTENLSMTSYEKPMEIPNIFFQFGKADLSTESTASLDMLAQIMNDNPNIVVELLAHTDNRGSDEANMILSQRRAQAVIDYLTVNGIEQERMIAKGLGESYPRTVTREIVALFPFLKAGQVLDEKFINTLSNEEQKEQCHALNRRTEIQVVFDKYDK